MPDISQLLLFIAAGWMLNLSPGPDVLYIVNSSIQGGVRAGCVAALGIVTGCFIHVLAAAFGVGALLATSATAFFLIKWLGAAYLMGMGVQQLYSLTQAPRLGASDRTHVLAVVDLGRVWRRGFLTNLLNPKVALFFMAFVPQFIAPGSEDKVLAFLLWGLLFNVNSLPINFGYAWFAGWVAHHAGGLQRFKRRMDAVSGLMYIGFGLRLALTDNPSR